MRAESALDALRDALKRLGLRLERVGMEACSLTAWLHDGLTAAGALHRDAPGRAVGLRGPHGPAERGDEDDAEQDRS